MKNSLTATLLAFALAMFVAPAQASVHITEPSVETFATSQLPSFIPGNPVALTEQDMKEVRGEVIWVPIMAGASLVAIGYLYYKWATDPEWVMDNMSASELFFYLQTPY